jgi:hypothetical protein
VLVFNQASGSRPQSVRSSSDRRVHAVRNTVQILIEEIGIDVQRHRCFGVAKHPLNRLHVGMRTDRKAGCVTEVEWRDGREGLVRRLAFCERSAGVRKLFRLIQLEQVAEWIVQEGLVPGAGDERGPMHLDALLLQVGDGRIYVVDSDREVVRTGLLRVGLHQVHLLAAGVEPVSRAEIGARQLRHAEHVAVKSEALLCVVDADGDMVHTGWFHHSILPRG